MRAMSRPIARMAASNKICTRSILCNKPILFQRLLRPLRIYLTTLEQRLSTPQGYAPSNTTP